MVYHRTGNTTVEKKKCNVPQCAPCDISEYCLNAGQTYTLVVQCWYDSNYPTDTTITVNITSNVAPTFYFKGK